MIAFSSKRIFVREEISGKKYTVSTTDSNSLLSYINGCYYDEKE